MKIFVSYSRRDAGDFADQIQRHLSSFKYDIFTDVNNIEVGDIWSNTIEENISGCDVFVVIVTDGALQSPYVENEVSQAQRDKKKIIPCFLRGINPKRIKWGLEKIQGVEFSDKYELARNLYSKLNMESYNRVDNDGGETRGFFYRISNKKSIIIISVTIISIIAIAGIIGMVGFSPSPSSPPLIDNGDNGSKARSEISSDVNSLFGTALSSYKIRQFSEVVDASNKVLQIEPNNVTAQFLKGLSLYNIENYNIAHKSFQQLIQLDPNNTKSLYYDGLSLYNLNRYNDAISEFNRVLALEPSNTHALFYKGLSLYNLDRYNEAIMQFNRVLALEPSNTNALLYKGLSLYNLDRYNEAIAYYEKVLELDPNNLNATKEKERTQLAQQNQSTTTTTTNNISNH